MSAATVAVNPPLAFTKDAIINRLRHQATNGPAYVQHSATKALAHLKGLYAEARYEARLAYEAARDALRYVAQEVTEQISPGYQRVVEIQNGAPLTEEEIARAEQHFKGTADEQEDEEGSNHDEDEPP
jgi:hypothetical protein